MTTCQDKPERLCFWLDNFRVDDWTITASSEAAGRPATNIQNPSLQTKWRTTTGASGQWIEGNGTEVNNDYIGVKLPSGIALINHNLSFNDSFRLQMWTGALMVYDSGNVAYRPDYLQSKYYRDTIDDIRPYPMRVIYITELTGTGGGYTGITRWRVTFNTTSSPAYYQLSRIMLVRCFQPVFGARETNLSTRDDSRVQTSEGGQKYIDRQALCRVLNVTMNAGINENDIMEWMRLIHINGKRIPIIIDTFPHIPDLITTQDKRGIQYANLTHQIYGVLNSSLSIQRFEKNLLRLSGRLVVEEAQ